MNQSAVRALCSCVVLVAVAAQAHAGASLSSKSAPAVRELEVNIRQRGADAHKAVKRDAIKAVMSKDFMASHLQASLTAPIPTIRITVIGDRETLESRAE